MRRFNTAGPVRPLEHYAIEPLQRADVAGFLDLIHEKSYFVLHAPRQTGKTSALLALRDLLNRGEAGDFRCVYVNVEVGQVARDDTARGMRSILSSLASNARLLGDDFPHRVWPDVLARAGPDDALKELLTDWCLANPTPLVLLVDEIDSLVGDTLLSVLRQLRAGYPQRPEAYPQSVVLCGVRDIRDYRIRTSSGEVIAGGSPSQQLDLCDVEAMGRLKLAEPERLVALLQAIEPELVRYPALDPASFRARVRQVTEQ